MKSIDKVRKLWSSLEEEFAKGNYESRYELLERLINYSRDTKKDNIGYIKLCLKSDIESYDEKDVEDMKTYLDKMELLAEALRENLVPKNIENLDVFIKDISVLSNVTSNNNEAFSAINSLIFRKEMSSVDSVSKLNLTLNEMLDKFDVIDDTVIFSNKNTLKLELHDDYAMSLLNLDRLQALLEGVKTGAVKSDFLHDVAHIALSVLKEEIISLDKLLSLVFIDKENFSKNGKIKIGTGKSCKTIVNNKVLMVTESGKSVEYSNIRTSHGVRSIVIV